MLKYPLNVLKNNFIFCDNFSDNPGQNYVNTSLRKAISHINRTPLPPNNFDAMIFFFTCLHNIVEGYRGIKEKTVNFTF